MTEVLQPQPYMKGKSKYLFWPFLAFLLISEGIQLLSYSLKFSITRSSGFGAGLAVSIVLAAFITIGGAALCIIYGVKCNVKLYKILMFVLAAVELPSMVSAVLSDVNYLSIISGNYHNATALSVVTISSSALGLLVRLAWVACLLIFTFSKPAGMTLRISAILLALAHLYMSAFSLAWGYLAQVLVSRFGQDFYQTVYMVLTIVNYSIYFGLSAFFFGALSFGKQKQARAAAIASGNLSVQ